ncbi:MAG: hypothetical protein JJV93_03055 [Alphaproteobacteria bacterium]|nr:hypothetical protein [Alphaproteobacteria bacterium]MBL0718206.1 hypothetical protein [Alphaproteobacteria bacterium]
MSNKKFFIFIFCIIFLCGTYSVNAKISPPFNDKNELDLSIKNILLSAESGLKVNRKKNTITATKNVKLVYQGIIMYSNKMTAYFDTDKKSDKTILLSSDSNSKVKLFRATGDVKIISGEQNFTIFTDLATFVPNTGIFVLTSNDGNITTLSQADTTVRTADKIIYNSNTLIAEVNNGEIINQQHILSAPKIVVTFEEEAGLSGLILKNAKTVGRTRIVSADQIMESDFATYTPGNNLAMLYGNVVLIKGDNTTVKGGKITYDMFSGDIHLTPQDDQQKIQILIDQEDL